MTEVAGMSMTNPIRVPFTFVPIISAAGESRRSCRSCRRPSWGAGDSEGGIAMDPATMHWRDNPS